MSILTQAMLFEKYGPRLSIDQLAELLNIKKTTLYNQISAKTCPVKTYLDCGQRWADFRDVAAHFDAMRAKAA
jgi:predicted DNA-binding transcriptional regulator AlpA